MDRLRGSDQRAAIFAAGARIGLDEVGHRPALQHLPGLIDDQRFRDRAVHPAHNLRGNEHDRGQHDAAQLHPGRKVRELEHGKIGRQIKVGIAKEELPVGALGRERQQRGRQIIGEGMLVALEGLHHVIDCAVPPMGVPHKIDRLVDKPAFGVIEPGLIARHLRYDGFEHRKAVDQIVVVPFGKGLVDHAKRVDRNARRQLELGECPAKRLGHMLEAAAIIDHDGLGPNPCKACREVLQQHRLARTGLARDRDIVVAGTVLEG